MSALTSVVRSVASLLFYVALPIALILGNVRWLVYSESHYLRGYDRYRVRETTGMSSAELERATREIQQYFRTGTPISLEIEKETGRAPLFNERELHHLRDVRDLLDALFGVQAVALAYIPLFGALCYRWYRGGGAVRAIGGEAVVGGLLTVMLLAAAGVVAASNFQQVFVQFHLLSFDNDLWILDPRTDYMIRMFPEGFWFESAMQVAGWTVAEALLIAGAGYLARTRVGGQAVVVPG